MEERDEREEQDRRQQILEAAFKVFSTKGFHKATNKDIAQAAGISPGLIYWYFKDKHELFFSMIRERAPIFQMIAHPERLMELPPREALALVGHSFLSTVRVPGHVALFRVMFSEAVRFPQIGEMVYNIGPRRIFSALTTYLQRQIELGRLRPHDTAIAARSFMGMLVVHVIAREIFNQPEARATADEQVVATAVDIFLQGLTREDGHAQTHPADHP